MIGDADHFRLFVVESARQLQSGITQSAKAKDRDGFTGFESSLVERMERRRRRTHHDRALRERDFIRKSEEAARRNFNEFRVAAVGISPGALYRAHSSRAERYIGGVESGRDAAEFILLGSDTVQVCTGVMKFGYGCVKQMCDELLQFMEKHNFETLADFKGKSLDYFTTHAELVRKQAERKATQAEAAEQKQLVKADIEWSGDEFVMQSNDLARN